MTERLPRTSWVFDRPLLRDALFWGGLTLGLVHAFDATSSVQFAQMSVVRQTVDLVWRVLMGVLIVGVIGGSMRNFVRGYRGTHAQTADEQMGSET